MKNSQTAVILIGYQNDYFSHDGALHGVIEQSSAQVLDKTLELINQLEHKAITIISTPIYFTPDYSELINPIGILKIIQDAGAFKKGTKGSEEIVELDAFSDRLLTVEGKRGLNAFHSTNLQDELDKRGIRRVVLAGVVTSLCIDSTARSAFELGYDVTILSDCTAGRTQYEQDFYCTEILPLYSQVMSSQEFLASLL